MIFPHLTESINDKLRASSINLFLAPILAITVLVPTFRFLYLDYRKFIALGPGGTPATIFGYLRIKLLGVFALRDALEAPPLPRHLTSTKGCLTSLAERQGLRPKTFGIAPHRQVTQHGSPHHFAALSAAISQIAEQNEHIEEGTSCFEKHGRGIFSTHPLRRTCGGEICHAHASDGSLHLTLHPADAKVMLDAGWGERHPLARGGWLERFVPGGFVMVYSPRDEDELESVLELVRAAAWWVGGEDIGAFRRMRAGPTHNNELQHSAAYHEATRSSIMTNRALFVS